MYRNHPSLYCRDLDEEGFEWIDCANHEESILVFLRKGDGAEDQMVIVLNFTPAPRFDYEIGVPEAGHWKEVLNSDAKEYGGSGIGNLGGVEAISQPLHGKPFSIKISLPPLAAIFLSRS